MKITKLIIIEYTNDEEKDRAEETFKLIESIIGARVIDVEILKKRK